MNKNLNNVFVQASNIGNLTYIQKMAGREEIDLNHQNQFGYTALCYACSRNHLEIVKYLLCSENLNSHANIHQACSKNLTPLMYACANGHLDVVRFLTSSDLLKEHANIYTKNGQLNALLYALNSSYYEVAQYLLLEKKMLIDNETMKLIEKAGHHDLIELIKVRDRYEQINQNLSIKASLNIIPSKRKI